MSFELRLKLERVARRIRRLRLSMALAFCWLLWAGVGMFAFGMTGQAAHRMVVFGWRENAALAAVTAVVCIIVASRIARDQRTVARRIEATHPELGALLLTAVEQNTLPREQLGYLQTKVIRDAVEHSRTHNWDRAVPTGRLRLARLANWSALALLVAVCVGLANRSGASVSAGLFSGLGISGSELDVVVDPGDCEIERGTSLVVVAQFGGAVPSDATLRVSKAAGPTQAVSMIRSLEDPKFVGRVAAVDRDLAYHVEFAGQQSDTFHVTVFEYPELVRADARLEFPTYTALEPVVVEDVRQVTAVEGTHLTLSLRLNKEVVEARLSGVGGEDAALERDDADRTLYRAAWRLAESRRFKLLLTDHQGRGSRLPAELVVNVTSNAPPKIVIERPGRDIEVSPLEELQLAATATDDFGVTQAGVSYTLGGGEPLETTLPNTGDSTVKQRAIEQLIDFESLAAEPDQLVSYFVWAEDIGPDGQPRRTMSDMYFAEVRPFDQIFRQGEQPTQNQQQGQQQQGQGGNQQETGELAELQKEIINATWKLIRRESGAKLSDEFATDLRLVEESQQTVIDRLSTLAERLQDSESLAHLQGARSHMNEALQQLGSAAGGPAAAPLRPALAAEQAAYQDLLKLRAREFQVVHGNQQQQGGQSGGGGNRSQRQLNQLELSADENRYETQTRATSPEETQAQRESREILNRLRDLARRQEDINERVRELQSALEQAQTERERAEFERELKRLRDQQQEILRETDDLISRVDRQGNQQQAQNAREQLDDARLRIQQASEALDNEQLSEAVNEGARAGQQLSELRDQFRQQAANRFAEEMTEMRRSARALDERQRQLSQQLGEENTGPGRSLRGSGSRAEVASGLAEQRAELQRLLEEMRTTVEEAEQPEPLLAKQLYDTAREAHQQRVENALDVARRLVDIGIEQEAGQAMRQADQGISNLREGVEQAAESVLGDETEALRRAQREVDRLAEELNREIDQARGPESPDSAEGPQEGAASSQRGADQRERAAEGRQPGQNRRRESSEDSDEDNPGRGREQDGQSGGRNNRDQNTDGGNEGNQNDRDSSEAEQPGGRQDGQQGGGGEPREDNDRPRDDDAAGERDGENRQRSSLRGGGREANRGGTFERFLDRGAAGRPGGPRGPITGEDFRDWADRLRDVEEMLDDVELRDQAARIRDRAEDARNDYRRHSQEPDWSKLQDLVAEPLVELSRRIDEAIRRRESPDALVPIDRDPVPPEFAEQVRRYYERLGSGE